MKKIIPFTTYISPATWQAYCVALRALAKRKNDLPEHEGKWQINFFDGVIVYEKCLICNQQWEASSKCTDEIRMHGILHLKEYNLLAFI